jgi:hypothetical protein
MNDLTPLGDLRVLGGVEFRLVAAGRWPFYSKIKDQVKLLFNRKERKDEPFFLRLFFLCGLCVLCG